MKNANYNNLYQGISDSELRHLISAMSLLEKILDKNRRIQSRTSQTAARIQYAFSRDIASKK
jgi:hypothetical protein